MLMLRGTAARWDRATSSFNSGPKGWKRREEYLKSCNVSPSPTDVSPTENSWMLHPLYKVSLGYFAPVPTITFLNSDLIERSDTRLPTVAPFSAAKWWSSMCGPSVHPTEGRQSNKPGQGHRRSLPDVPMIHLCRRPTATAADGASSLLDAVQGRDTSARGAISKGRFVQGVQHPRIFRRGHINPASNQNFY